MLPYNDVYVVLNSWSGDVLGVFSSEHLADLYVKKLIQSNSYTKVDLEVLTRKLNSMEV